MPFKAKCVGFTIELIGRKLVKTTVSFEHVLPITTQTDYWFLTDEEYQKLMSNYAHQSLGGNMSEAQETVVAAKPVAKKKTAKKAKKKVAKKAKKKTAKKVAKKK